ncbi:hypothetical protein [Pseudomonas cremoricolorata]|uniref:Uncharacterized protein n=1 Tax=Pseudomonas cremoricolorata TaxID=157783 RepID=A0A089WUI7_9PSED|nr:hypothetical protein [Pseudomonas cremoricolorata]AIR90207.1 hypothetical protein LK03_13285 [Pseudomonas cremoricolorata]
MIVDGLLVGLGAFGAAAFCFSAGLVVGGLRSSGAAVFPATHVSFDLELSDDARLEFLGAATEAVRSGQLRKTNQLGDYTAGDKGK